MELHKAGYVSQTVTYIKNKDYEKAYNFAKEFVEKFPDEVAAHYLLSASAFWLKRYREAILEGCRAFNKATKDDEMLPCVMIAASAYYELEEYEKGMKLLQIMEKRKKTENIEKLMFMFSMARKDSKEAAVHLNELYKMNREAAEELAVEYVK